MGGTWWLFLLEDVDAHVDLVEDFPELFQFFR